MTLTDCYALRNNSRSLYLQSFTTFSFGRVWARAMLWITHPEIDRLLMSHAHTHILKFKCSEWKQRKNACINRKYFACFQSMRNVAALVQQHMNSQKHISRCWSRSSTTKYIYGKSIRCNFFPFFASINFFLSYKHVALSVDSQHTWLCDGMDQERNVKRQLNSHTHRSIEGISNIACE